MTDAGTPRPGWVTKTNMSDFARCQRAFWLIANGVITHEESLSPVDRALADDGVDFEDDIVEWAERTPLVADRLGLPITLQQELYRNDELRMKGVPDGVETESGAWAPVEVKHHRHPTSLDHLELAFYWLVLSPMREDPTARPHGYLILKGDDGGSTEPLLVTLQAHHFAQVRQLVGDLRQARTGPEPYACDRCHVCNELRPQSAEMSSQRQESGYLGNLFGMGYANRSLLSRVGISCQRDLIDLGVDVIADRIAGRGWSTGRSHIEGWVAHAQAFAENRPVLFGSPPPMPIGPTAFDLEYLRGGPIWLAGMLSPDGELTQVWRWPEDDEALLLNGLSAYWSDRQTTTIATWWGLVADMPSLRRAAKRTGVSVEPDSDRHFDLGHWAKRHLRLPVRGMSLKVVAEYFGLTRAGSDVASGDEAVGLYLDAAAQGAEMRQAARARLERYNVDDLRGVLQLIEIFRSMYEQVPAAQATAPKPQRQRRRRTMPAAKPAASPEVEDPDAWMDADDVSFFA